MLIIFGVYALPFEILPRSYQFVRDQRVQIEKLQDEIKRYKKLADDSQFWQTQNQLAIKTRDEINTLLLQGNSRELVGAKMQGVLREIARTTGVNIKSLDLPDFSRTKEWVLVTQGVQFEGNSEKTLNFLKEIEHSKNALLVIVSVDVRSHRGLLNGQIKVTGFSRLPEAATHEGQKKS
jgi:hypothetical protein